MAQQDQIQYQRAQPIYGQINETPVSQQLLSDIHKRAQILRILTIIQFCLWSVSIVINFAYLRVVEAIICMVMSLGPFFGLKSTFNYNKAYASTYYIYIYFVLLTIIISLIINIDAYVRDVYDEDTFVAGLATQILLLSFNVICAILAYRYYYILTLVNEREFDILFREAVGDKDVYHPNVGDNNYGQLPFYVDQSNKRA